VLQTKLEEWKKLGSDWHNGTHNSEGEGKVGFNDRERSIRMKCARGYHKFLILIRGRYYVGWEVLTDVISSQILPNFFQNSFARHEGDTMSVGISQPT